MDHAQYTQAYQKFQKLYAEARQNHYYHPSSPKILIEVAAQHPLINGVEPNSEFRQRLDRGLELAHQLQSQHKVPYIYVPGSRHRQGSQTDQISLSQAGKQYLVAHNFPAQNIFADEQNEKYKGEDGVYNSIDECDVVSSILKDGQYQKLICICSPAQLLRKALAYISFGVLSDMVSVPCDDMFHNYIDETFKYIPDFILHQNDGEMAKLRQYRRHNNSL